MRYPTVDGLKTLGEGNRQIHITSFTGQEWPILPMATLTWAQRLTPSQPPVSTIHHLRPPVLPTPHNPMTLLPRRPPYRFVPRLTFLILQIRHGTRGDRAEVEGMVEMRVLAGNLADC